ncbi:MAG: glutamate formimidoyltransferase, partial [Solirubrobacteraceae bacterium]
AIAAAAGSVAGVVLLDRHSDPDHHRTVLTLGGRQGSLHEALLVAGAAAIDVIDLRTHAGAHPRVGALDIAPIVHLDASERGAACAEALTLADRLAEELKLPVFLYGALSEHGLTRAQIRRGGPAQLQARIDAGEMQPDFGPRRLHPSAGAVLVAARPPLVAFNVELEPPADLRTARQIAALVREGGAEGLPGLRAIGVELRSRGGIAQVSMNLEDHDRLTLAEVLHAVSRHARPAGVELVGLAPRAALAGFPADLPVANRRTIEEMLRTG